MAIVLLQLPKVKRETEGRPKRCPYCDGEIFQRWGQGVKPVKDSSYRTVRVYRYRCCRCQHTFRYYPEGVDRHDQTERLRKLAAICWVLGLSLRGVATILLVFGVNLCHMSVWRDIQEQAKRLEKQHRWQGVRVMGVDGAYPLGWGKKQPVVVAVNLGNGQVVKLGQVDESNPQALRRFLEPLVQSLGVSVIVSDDLASYRLVTQQLGVEHQVCQFHVRRWVGRVLHELRGTVPKEYLGMIDEIQALLEDLPPEGSRRLFELWKQIPERRKGQARPLSPLSQLRALLIRLSEHWESYRVFSWHEDVPWTNNGTEQAIGRMKMRSRTVRGYKSWEGMQAALILSTFGTSF